MDHTLQTDETIDATGLRCPEPVMMLHAAMRRAKPGALLALHATDPSTRRDVANFCRFLNHELVASDETSESLVYWIRKSEG